MGKRISIKRIEPLVLVFEDGTEKEAVFNNEALINLALEFGDINTLLEAELTKPMELASKILYSGMKVMDTTVTMDDAKVIMMGGGTPLMLEVFNSLTESFGGVDPEELKKNLMPIMAKLIQNQKQ